MARIRTIKPDFWTDEHIVELSAFARLLFIGLWNFADDDGRMEYSPKRIKMQIFPADSVEVSELFGEIRRECLVTIYEVDGKEFLQIKNFGKHQKVDKRTPSKIPAPPNYPPISTELPQLVPTEGNGREGKGKKTRASALDTSPEVLAEFDVWYAAYPRHEAKDEARIAYLKARKRADVETLLSGARGYAAKPGRVAEFTKLPATWLNKGCWQDEKTIASAPAARTPDNPLGLVGRDRLGVGG